MSQSPGGFPQPHPLSYAPPPISPRPSSVTVVAIIGIVLGGSGTLCLGLSAITAPFVNTIQQPSMRQPTDLVAWNVIQSVIGFALSVVLLIASIAALSLRRWSRTALIWVSVADIFWQVLKATVGFAWALPKMKSFFAQVSANLPPGQNPFSGGGMGNLITLFGGIGIGLSMFIAMIFPIVTMIIMRSKDVIAAFGSGAGPSAPAPFPPPPPGYPPPYNS